MVFEAINSILTNNLLNQAGLWALLALIPLVLVYLIRPRPKKQAVPALMFLIKERAKAHKSSFLRRFINDPLFFFQILVIIVFAAAIAKPFITVSQEVFVEKTALVIDVSASSQVTIDGKSRFEKSIELAEDNVGSDNVLILMSSVPELVADSIDASETKRILKDLIARDTPTNIFDSIIFAGNYVKENDRVVVISDFIETGSEKNFNAAKDILESKGIIVEMIDIKDYESRKAFNIGIIETVIAEEKTTIQIRNFNEVNETIGIRMEGVNLSIPEFTIAPNDVEVLSFPTPADTAKFWLVPYSGNDDFEVDNTVFIAAPSDEPISILLISNSVSRYLDTALEVIDNIKVDRFIPPQTPDVGHQVIIYNNVQSDLILPSTIKKIKKKVEDGAAFIVVGQEGLLKTDFLGMLPVERADESVPFMTKNEVYVSATTESSLTEDINFGKVSEYLNMRTKDGGITIVSSPDNATLVAMRNQDKGSVVYFGLMDKYSDFKEDIYYPVFWKRLFDMLTKKQDLSELNFKTGRLVNLLEEQTIKAPFGKIKADTIVLTKQGIYEGEEKIFAANLGNEEESDVNGDNAEEKIGVFDDALMVDDEFPLELAKYIIIALLLLVFLELIWIKFRGDL